MISKQIKFITEKVYANSGLGKWFNKESAGGGPGWDRYNTKGERIGKCGDAKEGEPYSACLSRQKADKLGKEKVGSFVRRKRSAQKKAGRGKKGSVKGKGKKPVFVETGVTKLKESFDYFLVENTELIPLSFATIEAKELLPFDIIINESGQIFNVDLIEVNESKIKLTLTDEKGCEVYESFDPETVMGFVDTSEGHELNEFGENLELHETKLCVGM
jgi:hypothetical protein